MEGPVYIEYGVLDILYQIMSTKALIQHCYGHIHGGRFWKHFSVEEHISLASFYRLYPLGLLFNLIVSLTPTSMHENDTGVMNIALWFQRTIQDLPIFHNGFSSLDLVLAVNMPSKVR
jgi:hypothetical protein